MNLRNYAWCWLALLAAPVHAQNYPAKPIRFIVGFPPGGATEFIARLIGQKLTQSIGQQVIIDNRPGAAGNLGIELAAQSTDAVIGTPEEFGAYVKQEIAKWAAVVRRAGIQPE